LKIEIELFLDAEGKHSPQIYENTDCTTRELPEINLQGTHQHANEIFY
jgi:hypothetical protein